MDESVWEVTAPSLEKHPPLRKIIRTLDYTGDTPKCREVLWRPTVLAPRVAVKFVNGLPDKGVWALEHIGDPAEIGCDWYHRFNADSCRDWLIDHLDEEAESCSDVSHVDFIDSAELCIDGDCYPASVWQEGDRLVFEYGRLYGWELPLQGGLVGSACDRLEEEIKEEMEDDCVWGTGPPMVGGAFAALPDPQYYIRKFRERCEKEIPRAAVQEIVEAVKEQDGYCEEKGRYIYCSVGTVVDDDGEPSVLELRLRLPRPD